MVSQISTNCGILASQMREHGINLENMENMLNMKGIDNINQMT